MVRQIVAAREEERARIARDLHDQVGQQLTALRLMLEHHQAECRLNSQAAVSKALGLAREIDAEIDSLAWELRPNVVDELGLAASLHQLVERWAEYAAVDAECRCDIPRGRLPLESEVAAYRVTQEALHNVLKHARATHVMVIGEILRNSLVLLVHDDGIGFKPGYTGAAAGMGLRGMRERAVLVGAALDVTSSPGRGTTVSLRIPIANASPVR
jgi:two-component system sensor histidine kinase UhpB